MTQKIVDLARDCLAHIVELNIERANLSKAFTRHKFNLRRYQNSSDNQRLNHRLYKLREQAKVGNYRFVGRFYHQQIMEKKVGNCAELAYLGFVYLKQIIMENCDYEDIHSVEMIAGLAPFDHTFLAINRTNMSENGSSFALTFDSSVHIIDPWLNCWFTADKVAQYYADVARIYEWGVMRELRGTNTLGIYKKRNEQNQIYFTMKCLDNKPKSPDFGL